MSVQTIAVLLDLPLMVDGPFWSLAEPCESLVVVQIIAARLQESRGWRDPICPFRNSKLQVFPINEL